MSKGIGKGWTIQALIDGDMSVTAYCHNSACHHYGKLDLLKMREKLGPDAPAMEGDIRDKIRCSKCGGKRLGLIYSPLATSKASADKLRKKRG